MATVTANETTAGDSLETLRENLNLLRSDMSGLSAAELTGSTDNTITTVTGSGAIQGEANLTFDGSTLTVTGAVTSSGLITANGNIVIANDGNIGSAGDTDAISIDSSGNVTISQNLTVSGTQTTVDTVTMNAANAIVFEGATADAHETTLSIVDPTGDHTQYLINQGGYIPVLAAVTTTAITSTPAELNLLDDAAANSVVNSKAVIYGSSGELAGTLSTAAQGNVTSLGTLTTLTVDNIIINGTNIGHTSDTDSIAIASNGVVTFSQAPVFPDGSIDLDDLDIDGGTDIGAGLADADLFIVDDAAGGTNRKSAASRIKTYIADVTLTTAAQTNITSLGTLTTLTVDNIIINGTNIGHTSDTDSIAIASNGVVTFSAAPVFPDGSIDLADLDIDGGTDIGAGIADSDLMIIDDGGGGTNRKVAASRFKTYIGSTSGALDDLTVGDAASTLATSAGNITIDAQGNNTDIIFKGTDATADITMLTLDGSEAGQATFTAGILLPDDGTIGSASANSAMTIDSNGIVTFVDDILIKDGGTIGSASDADAIAIAANGVVTFSQVPVLPNNTVETADIQDNAVSLAKMAVLARGKIIYGDSSGDPAALAVGSANYVLTSDGTDISWAAAQANPDPASADGDSLGTASAEWSDLYLADGGIIYFGNDQDITVTHVADVGLTLTHTATGDNTPMVLQLKSEEDGINANEVISSLEFAAGDSNGGDGAGVAAGIHAIAEDTFSATVNATKLVFTTGVSETAAASATAKATLSSIGDFQVAGDLVVKDAGLIGSDSDKDAISIGSDGDVTLTQDLELQHDGATISFGANDEITITHDHDVGLKFKHSATADDKPIVLTLQTGETDMAANDVIGALRFQAPDEGTGTDAITVAAAIEAVAEGDFSSSNNATKISFKCGNSEAATEKAKIVGSTGYIHATPTAILLIVNSSGSTLKTINGISAI